MEKKFAQGIHGFESMRLNWTNEILFDGHSRKELSCYVLVLIKEKGRHPFFVLTFCCFFFGCCFVVIVETHFSAVSFIFRRCLYSLLCRDKFSNPLPLKNTKFHRPNEVENNPILTCWSVSNGRRALSLKILHGNITNQQTTQITPTTNYHCLLSTICTTMSHFAGRKINITPNQEATIWSRAPPYRFLLFTHKRHGL